MTAPLPVLPSIVWIRPRLRSTPTTSPTCPVGPDRRTISASPTLAARGECHDENPFRPARASCSIAAVDATRELIPFTPARSSTNPTKIPHHGCPSIPYFRCHRSICRPRFDPLTSEIPSRFFAASTANAGPPPAGDRRDLRSRPSSSSNRPGVPNDCTIPGNDDSFSDINDFGPGPPDDATPAYPSGIA